MKLPRYVWSKSISCLDLGPITRYFNMYIQACWEKFQNCQRVWVPSISDTGYFSTHPFSKLWRRVTMAVSLECVSCTKHSSNDSVPWSVSNHQGVSPASSFSVLPDPEGEKRHWKEAWFLSFQGHWNLYIVTWTTRHKSSHQAGVGKLLEKVARNDEQETCVHWAQSGASYLYLPSFYPNAVTSVITTTRLKDQGTIKPEWHLLLSLRMSLWAIWEQEGLIRVSVRRHLCI